MESIYFKEDHRIFRKTVKNFVNNEIRPYAEHWEEEQSTPRDLFKRMGELGFFGIIYPEEYGGSNADYFMNIVFLEELSKCGALGTVTSILVHTNVASPAIHYLGTHEQKMAYLSPVIAGESICALGVTEPNHGSDVASIETKAVKNGDHYVISGSKTFITNGSIANQLTLAARTGGEGNKGISLFLFDTDTPGFSVGRKVKKMGMLTSDTAELSFEDCVVPAANLLGREGQGFLGIMAGFENERIAGAAQAYSAAELALDLSVQYSKERRQFGREIGEFQAVSHMLAEMATDVEAARQLTYQAAWLKKEGKPCLKEIQMAKLLASETAKQVADKAVQIHGGYGYCREYEVERIYRDVRLICIGAGTSQIMKNIIAKQLRAPSGKAG